MNFLQKLSFLVVLSGFFCVYAVGQLLYVLLVFIRNPRRVLRKTARDSNRIPSLPAVSDHKCSAFFCVCSPSSVSTGPESGLPRVCDCQWDQVPLCLCRRHLQTTHAPPPRLPRGHHSLLTTITTLTHDTGLDFHTVLVLVALSVERVLQRLSRGRH